MNFEKETFGKNLTEQCISIVAIDRWNIYSPFNIQTSFVNMDMIIKY